MTNRFLFVAVMLLSIAMTAQDKPNVVLILADDMGYGDVSVLNPELYARYTAEFLKQCIRTLFYFMVLQFYAKAR